MLGSIQHDTHHRAVPPRFPLVMLFEFPEALARNLRSGIGKQKQLRFPGRVLYRASCASAPLSNPARSGETRGSNFASETGPSTYRSEFFTRIAAG